MGFRLRFFLHLCGIFILVDFFVFLQKKSSILKIIDVFKLKISLRSTTNVVIWEKEGFYKEGNDIYFHFGRFLCIFAKEKGKNEKSEALGFAGRLADRTILWENKKTIDRKKKSDIMLKRLANANRYFGRGVSES